MTQRGGEEGQESGGQDLCVQVEGGTEDPSNSKLCGPSQTLSFRQLFPEASMLKLPPMMRSPLGLATLSLVLGTLPHYCAPVLSQLWSKSTWHTPVSPMP